MLAVERLVLWTHRELRMKEFLKLTLEKQSRRISLKVALVVGTILAMINYANRIFVARDMA